MHSDNNHSTSIDTHPPTANPPTSDPAPVWEIADESEAPKTPYGQSAFVYDFSRPGASSPDEQATWPSIPDQLTAQPGDDDPAPPRRIRKERESYAAQVADRHFTWRTQAAHAHLFEELISGRLRKGIKVELSDGQRHPTSIQRSGERFCRRTLSLALENTRHALREHGLHFSKTRVEQLTIRFSEALALQDLLDSEMSPPEIAFEAELALSAVLDALKSHHACRKV